MSDGARGRLTIYMGYAAGVGKTYRMLEDAHRLKDSGVDVIVGYFEPHGRKDTIDKLEGLELIPRKKVAYRGSEFEEMDTDAILARRPRVAAVDEFPHTNVPGSARGKRWEDVEALLDAGIDVLTTMNIQHLESLCDQVWHITGVRVRETIPDWVVNGAAEVVMVDVTPRALRHRLERGVVYGAEKSQAAMQNFFRESTLAALRELALRETAHEVTHRTAPSDGRVHKILVVVTARPETAMLIRRAKRVADFLGAECFAVAVGSVSVSPNDHGAAPSRSRFSGSSGANGGDGQAIERHLNFARNLHIEARVLEGADPVRTIIDFARRNDVTQIFLTRERGGARRPFWSRDLVQRVVRLAQDMQVVIVADRTPFRRA